MTDTIEIIDTGLAKYMSVWALQKRLFTENTTAKATEAPSSNYLILCEHEPVFTLGKSGKEENIIAGKDELQAEYYHVDRGGDITFHGPGQLVVYPILDLDSLGIGLAKYIYLLEETVMLSLKAYGLSGQRVENAAGIWICDSAGERKICAIGVKASRNITMHGLAMNVTTQLSYFDKIIPCGLQGKGVTSLQKELNKQVPMEDYKSVFTECFFSVFNIGKFENVKMDA
jgi:lipoyl(octanoyl) transferase